jgi:DNA-binding XRE family transcriptional regulator
VEWPGTWLEIAGDTLWRLSERQLGNTWPPEEFKAWRKRLGLTQEAAALELGVTRRAIVHYERGARSISKVVRLACEAVEMHKRRAA